jgi:hypothetical protein
LGSLPSNRAFLTALYSASEAAASISGLKFGSSEMARHNEAPATILSSSSSVSSASSSGGGKTGYLDSESAIRCDLPGTHVTLKLYGASFSQNPLSLALVMSSRPFLKTPSSGLGAFNRE